MHKLSLFAFLAAAGCLSDTPALATLEAATTMTRKELEDGGFQCTQYVGYSKCVRCDVSDEAITDAEKAESRTCMEFGCLDGATECEYLGSYKGSTTYEQDLNFWFEAEAMSALGSMQKTADVNASTGSYVAVAGGGSLSDTFEAPSPVTVYAWARVIAPSSSANAIHFQVGAQSIRWELPIVASWTWLPVRSSSGADVTWSLATGWHQVGVYTDEVGVKVDRILVTDNPDFVPVAHTVQAETAAIVAPMRVGSTSTLPRTSYVWVPNGAGTNGLAQLELDLPYAGTYTVWGRFNAPTEADNSFDLAKHVEQRTVWSMATTSASGWRWDRADVAGVPTLLTLARSAVIEIWQREDGTKLDKLVLTNDPGFTLVEPSTGIGFEQ